MILTGTAPHPPQLLISEYIGMMSGEIGLNVWGQPPLRQDRVFMTQKEAGRKALEMAIERVREAMLTVDAFVDYLKED